MFHRLADFIEIDLAGADPAQLEKILADERPHFRGLFGATYQLDVPAGLEQGCMGLLREWPEVESVGLDTVAFIPECPPPFGPAFQPGRVVVQFRRGLTAEDILILGLRLPPGVEHWEPEQGSKSEGVEPSGQTRAVVRVIPGRERFFLDRLLSYSEVTGGRVLPVGTRVDTRRSMGDE